MRFSLPLYNSRTRFGSVLFGGDGRIFCNSVVSFPSYFVVPTLSCFFKVKVLLFSWKYQACPGLWKKCLLRQFVSVLSDVFDLVGIWHRTKKMRSRQRTLLMNLWRF